MGKIIASEWVSLDGVFDAGLMDQWQAPYHSDSRAEYIRDSIVSCDAMLYGRKTYEMLAPYWSTMKNNEMGVADKLNNGPKYVVSTTMKEPGWGETTLIREHVVEEIGRLKNAYDGYILIQGSAMLVGTLLEAGLIDELRLLVHPVIMGKGQRFFPDGMQVRLQQAGVKELDLGVIALYYQAKKG